MGQSLISGLVIDDPAEVETVELSPEEILLGQAIKQLRRGHTHAALTTLVLVINQVATAKGISADAHIA